METPSNDKVHLNGEATIGGQGVSVLGDPHRLQSDCAMVRRAVRLRWPVPQNKRPSIVDRLVGIVEKESVIVPGEKGGESEVHADVNAIAAARVLVAMEAANQSDDQLETKVAIEQRDRTPSVTTVIVQRVGQVTHNHAAALPRGPIANGELRPTIQRGDVRPAIGQDDNGRVSGD